MIRRPPRSTLFPTRRSSDLEVVPGDLTDPASLRAATRGASAVISAAAVTGATKAPRGGYDRVNADGDRKSTRLNSSHANISYAVFCLKKKTIHVILLQCEAD